MAPVGVFNNTQLVPSHKPTGVVPMTYAPQPQILPPVPGDPGPHAPDPLNDLLNEELVAGSGFKVKHAGLAVLGLLALVAVAGGRR